MAMNFFEQQAKARKKTGRLVMLFILGVAGLIASTYFVGLACVLVVGHGDLGKFGAVNLPLFGICVLVTGAMVLFGYMRKAFLLSAGGHAVAESMGGWVIEPSTGNPDERQVLNVVEEMAIASGLPVPPVYLIDDESINAFAAGFRPEQAVIGITRGAVQAFSRDELQGVIGHEFSHILNGDMRLNIRLIAVVFGLAALTTVGYVLVRVLGRGGGGKRDGRAVIVLLIAGCGLMVIGCIGQFFGRLMQAAVSRQREFLADASSVQFTRNPTGLASALKTISVKSSNTLENAHAGEYCHMYFTKGINSIFATHPPLEERIARIEAIPVERAVVELERAEAGAAPGRAAGAAPPVGASPRARAAYAEPEPMVSAFTSPTRSAAGVAAAAAAIGSAPPDAIEFARAARSRIPASLLAAAREPFDARGIVCAILLSGDLGVRERQLQMIRGSGDEGLLTVTQRHAGAVSDLARDLKLPLVDLCVPALSRLSAPQVASFAEVARQLIAADAKLDLLEWAVRTLLRRAFVKDRPRATATLSSQIPALTQVLAILALAGSREDAAAISAYTAGFAAIGMKPPALPARESCTLEALDAAVRQLATIRTSERDAVVQACVAVASADEVITVSEAELLRAVITAIGAPMPPILPSA